MEDDEEITEDQTENSPGDRLRPWQFKPGQSGNPGGRPKGSVSLKEYAKQYLRGLSDEEKQEFMKGLNKDVIWKMAEGNPEIKADIKTDKIAENLTDEEIEMAKQLINERRSKTISVEG